MNEHGQDFGNGNITEPMPWLQDFDTNGDGLGEVWQLWDVDWRDLTILDRENVPVITFNLTKFNLADPANLAQVREAFLAIARTGDPPAEGEPVAAEMSIDEVLTLEHDWLTSFE